MFRERREILRNRAVRLAGGPTLGAGGFTPHARMETGEAWMMVVCRNEALRLPFMHDYHFRLGVSRVLHIDNVSTDGAL